MAVNFDMVVFFLLLFSLFFFLSYVPHSIFYFYHSNGLLYSKI